MFNCNALGGPLESTFKLHYAYMKSRQFFGLVPKKIFNEKYFQMILLKAIDLIDPQPALVIPEFPYPNKSDRLMDIFVAHNNAIEIKYLRSGGTGKLTIERGRFYGDICKLSLFCPEKWDTFLFLILDETIDKHFQSFKFTVEKSRWISVDLVTLKPKPPIPPFINKLKIEYPNPKTQKTLYKKVRDEIGNVKFEEVEAKLDLRFYFTFPAKQIRPSFHFYFLQLSEKKVLR